MIEKDSEEYKVWGDAYKLRGKYKNNPELFTDKGFKQMVDDTTELYEKYKTTNGEQAALYLCLAIRDMCNEDWNEHKRKETR